MSTTDTVVVAIDQGTSSTKVLVVDARGRVLAQASEPVGITHPQPGWVQQDGDEIVASVQEAVRAAVSGYGHRVAAIGISAQRESALIWDRATGELLGPVLGWQDRRTADAASRLVRDGAGAGVRARTGLPIDPMFSALKLAWLLDQVDPDRTLSASGRIAGGTIDSWLTYRLTGEHRIERGNASRTQLLDVDSGEWDPELLDLFRVPLAVLPPVVTSVKHSARLTDPAALGITSDPRIAAVLGDSHAALFGHGARDPGAVKVTYGTGSSIMGLGRPRDIGDGLVRTIAWDVDGIAAALEGNILSTGASLVWLGHLLGRTPGELMDLAAAAHDDHGVDLVPAFNGLGAPWWDDRATGLLSGVTLSTDAGALARATAESIALQVEDVLVAADTATGQTISTILADGGPSGNDWLMQLQADLSQRRVVRADVSELSALGVAHLAGISGGLWTPAEVLAFERPATEFLPRLAPEVAATRRSRWLGAVARSRSASVASRTAAPVN